MESPLRTQQLWVQTGALSAGCHRTIFNHIRLKPKYVLEADIEKCFDRISHAALLAKLSSIPPINRQVRGWLKAGIFENGEIFPAEAGTPQGGVISPLLANIALHGLEATLVEAFSKRNRPVIIRFADDFDLSDGKANLAKYADTHIRRHVKAQGSEKPLRWRLGLLDRAPGTRPKQTQPGNCLAKESTRPLIALRTAHHVR
jgi:hypothetical protein